MQALVNAVMNLWAPAHAQKLLSSWAIGSFSRRALITLVSYHVEQLVSLSRQRI
jgi:hypothetical protein